MTTFLERLTPPAGGGPTLAVKNLVDVEGVVTTAACRAVAADAAPATADATVVQRARAAGARLVGVTNLHELAYGGTGVNEAFGTPVNPLDPTRIPGGSSSGSAVAVATGEADVAIGTDTAGSIRTPSACCGTVGLKTTWGRIPTDGVRALAPSLDTVGPMARTVADVARGLALLDPGFDPDAPDPDGTPSSVGRLRLPGVDPVVDAAVDRALALAGLATIDVVVPGWDAATDAGIVVLLAEAAQVLGHLLDGPTGRLGDDVRERLEVGRALPPTQLTLALEIGERWRVTLSTVLARFGALAMPTLPVLAPRLDDPAPHNGPHSAPINLAGVPALAVPVPSGGPIPASLQLVGPHHGEARLLRLGALVEAAVA